MNWANIFLENFKKAEEPLKKLGNDMSSWSKTIDMKQQITIMKGNRKRSYLERDAENRLKIVPARLKLDYSKELLESKKKSLESKKKSLSRRIERFRSRLQSFVDTGLWKVRKEIKITDEDPKLQKLLIYFTRENLDIESFAKETGLKHFKSTQAYSDLKSILTQAQEKIQSELKLREIKSQKRKMMFLLE